MARRVTKQILYALFYLIFWGLVIWAVYALFLRPAPSCQNNRQDVGEEGIDCGGICTNACLPTTLRTIETVGAIRLFNPNPQTLEVAAKIQNANPEFSAKSFTYRFNIFDASGQQVDTIAGDSFIYAGEIKYLAAIKTNIGYTPASVELITQDPNWVKAADYTRPLLGNVQEQKTEVSTSTVAVSGRISNRDVVTLSNVSVIAIFHDSLGLPIGISQTELDSLAPEESRPFNIFHPTIFDVDPGRTEIFISARRP